jgi:hypothetical protein
VDGDLGAVFEAEVPSEGIAASRARRGNGDAAGVEVLDFAVDFAFVEQVLRPEGGLEAHD